MDTKIPVRNLVAALFGLVLFFGVYYKSSGTARPGGVTEIFDTVLIVVGAVGLIAALSWPTRKDPDA